MVKEAGEGDSSHLAPPCKWMQLAHFLDGETEGSLEGSKKPQEKHNGGPKAANTHLQPAAEETHSVAVWRLLGRPAAGRRVSAADCSNSEGKTHIGRVSGA